MVRKCGITVHYFCMLFSSGLSQRGKTEEDGIYGFLPSDIGKEKTRGARLKCTFCRKNGATIGCVVKNCRKVFHFGCGQKAGALNQYFDSYRSFCTSHRPRQTCPALAAGLYFFKCPLCCNKEIFQAEMLQVGIYIPEQDAAWEMEPHAYQELLEPYNHCDMDACLCPRGRKYNRDDSKWEIVVCHWCGSQGSHIGCFSRKNTPTSSSGSRRVRWSCQSCALIDDELRKERRKKKASCSPVNQDSVELPSGKSLTQSEHVGRKLPVKRSNTLQSSSVSTEQNDGESSTSSPSDLSGNQSASTLTPRIRRNRKQKRNLWKRGLLLRSTAKKRKVISATVTQAEATLAANESCLDEQSPSQEVNAENVNPSVSLSQILIHRQAHFHHHHQSGSAFRCFFCLIGIIES
ncbi:G2H3 [Acanthosepion pharaonis]|uniref:G2H3 n=1 Tax=Acanthosepion pharaonis TaxID=158019 RepID=A0A812DV95_ACAPH|nr:G2H3 [Sepia pharaonis]